MDKIQVYLDLINFFHFYINEVLGLLKLVKITYLDDNHSSLSILWYIFLNQFEIWLEYNTVFH